MTAERITLIVDYVCGGYFIVLIVSGIVLLWNDTGGTYGADAFGLCCFYKQGAPTEQGLHVWWIFLQTGCSSGAGYAWNDLKTVTKASVNRSIHKTVIPTKEGTKIQPL